VHAVALVDDIENEVEFQAIVIAHSVTSSDVEYEGAAVLPGPNVTINVFDTVPERHVLISHSRVSTVEGILNATYEMKLTS